MSSPVLAWGSRFRARRRRPVPSSSNCRVRSFLVTAAVGLLLVAPGERAHAQEAGHVVGVVVDAATGEGLAEVRISVVGEETTSRTDDRGRFRLEGLPEGSVLLRFERDGYVSALEEVEVPTDGPGEVEVELPVLAGVLQELAVRGAPQPPTAEPVVRERATERSGRVSEAEARNRSGTVADLLQGRMPGLNVRRASGSAGSQVGVLIRGVNSISLSNNPLIVVDGIRIGGGGGGTSAMDILDEIPAAQVRSIEVLRGPSASARYGMGGGNGVIVIETRRGVGGG